MDDLHCKNCGWPKSLHDEEFSDRDTILNVKGIFEHSFNSCPCFEDDKKDD